MADKNVETGGTSSETDKTNAVEMNATNIAKKNPQDIFHIMTKAWRKQINHVQGQLAPKLRPYKTIVVLWKNA